MWARNSVGHVVKCALTASSQPPLAGAIRQRVPHISPALSTFLHGTKATSGLLVLSRGLTLSSCSETPNGVSYLHFPLLNMNVIQETSPESQQGSGGDMAGVNSESSPEPQPAGGGNTAGINSEFSPESQQGDGPDTAGLNSESTPESQQGGGADTAGINSETSPESQQGGGADTAGINSETTPESQQGGGADTAGINSETSPESQQGDGANTAGLNSESTPESQQGGGADTAGINSGTSPESQQGGGADTAGINSEHNSIPEASQSDHEQGSPQDSSLESLEGSTPAPGKEDTVETSSRTPHLETHQESSPAESDAGTAEIISQHDSHLEESPRNDQGQENGRNADLTSPQDSGVEALRVSDSAQGVGETADISSRTVAGESKEALPEAEESPADIKPTSAEVSSVVAAANGNDIGGSNSLHDSTHAHHTGQNTPQESANVSNSVQEIGTLSNTETTNSQTSDITTSAYSYPDQTSNAASLEHTSEAANKVSQSPAKLSPAVCPFSDEPLHTSDEDDNNSPKKINSESTNSKDSNSDLNPKITSIPQRDSHQETSDAEKARPANAAPEDTLLLSSRSPGQSQPTGRGIRNLFPQVSADSTTVGSEGSNSETTAVGESTTSDNHTTEETVEGDVVLVTGGSGFLGQHIVKLLTLRAPHVGEIRVLDLVQFEKKLDYPATKPVKSLVGDISNSEFVHRALKGVNSVIHVAGVVSWGTFPDYDGMEKVNVKGTLNVLNACLENNVQRLVYCSTVDVVVGNKPIRGGTEDDTPIPDKFLFPGYPETKFHGERIILGSAKLRRRDGEHLQTVILRPNVLYGELDKYYVTNTLRMAKQSMGVLYRIGNGKAMFQQAYVGNAAWAFVCADAAMKANPALTGEVFYVPDNTPVQNSFNFMIPYLQAHGLQLSDGYLSYALSHSAVAAAEVLAKVMSPLIKVNLPVQSCTIAYINTDLYFRGEKAQRVLNYYPIYTPSDARELSMKFYASLELEERSARGRNPEQR